MRMHLTDETVAALKPAARRYDACDFGNPSFLVRVSPRGTKSYYYRYRIKDTVRMMLLGRTSYMNCATAKHFYLEARRKRLSGEDPQGIHPATREADELLLELWYPYETTGRPPEIFSSPVTMEGLTAHYGVTESPRESRRLFCLSGLTPDW